MNESLLSAKPAVAAVVLGLLWVLEGLIPMFEGRRDRARHSASNVLLGVVNAGVAAVLFAGATLAATAWARDHSFGVLHWARLDGVVAAAAAFLLIDLWQYAWHRLNHRLPFLWRFHAVHHADRDLEASSGLRFHTGEIVLSSVARLAVLPLLGASIWHVVLYEAVLLPVILFHHANVRMPEGADRRLCWLLVTPRMHWVHHSRHRPETDSNYSSVFSFWDRVFGSFRLSRRPGALRLGLDGMQDREWATLPGMLAMPFGPAGSRQVDGDFSGELRADGSPGETESSPTRAEKGSHAVATSRRHDQRDPRGTRDAAANLLAVATSRRRDQRDQRRGSGAQPDRAVRAAAPASVSNLGCGFDVFGLALEQPLDWVEARAVPGRGVVSVSVKGDGDRVPSDPKRNAAAIAAQAVLDRTGSGAGMSLAVRKGVPLSSGLGGSAASAVAGAVAADALLAAELGRDALLECALAGEEKGSGAAHADNVAPALEGGFTLVLPGAPPRVTPIPTPADLAVAVVHPHTEVETASARALLGDSVPLDDAVRQWARTAGLVAGLHREDWELIGRCLVDAVAEPARARLAPWLEAVKTSAMDAGAAGAGLSGSGPSVFALCRGRETAEQAAKAMKDALRRTAGLSATVFLSGVASQGARVSESTGDPL